jgi:hypothetical protein
VNLLKCIRNQWDRVGAWLCIGAGLVALLLGYLGVSGNLETGKQLPFVVSGGVFGLFLLGLGALLWLSADRRDEWRKLDGVDRHLLDNGRLTSRDSSDSGSSVPARSVGRLLER